MYSLHGHKYRFKFKRKYQQYGPFFQTIVPFLMTMMVMKPVLKTFKTLLKYSNKFKFHLSIKRDKPELNINIYSFLIDCFVLIMIVSYCSVLIKYLLVPVKHPSSFNEISLTFWQEFIVTRKHCFYTLRFIFLYFLSLFFLFSIAQ